MIFDEEARHGKGRRGDLAAAIKAIATQVGINSETARTYSKRYKFMRGQRHLIHRLLCDLAEIDRRMSLFPVDVREKLMCVSAGQLLAYLRRNGISGTCSRQLAEWVRSGDFLSPN